ncbi:hypothetical protein PGT21_013955 [Puccinia graminis f. sp. tritici]|uniref:Uncharacterized protein n=1 Tax=Puccinia graminis f. sp. tritici TaxID=56615 RepID=A0A5B0QF92_PUCGR|nr:hypothetical protein PGT21_013955 [Puccinia graminis f. sp. tritici]
MWMVVRRKKCLSTPLSQTRKEGQSCDRPLVVILISTPKEKFPDLIYWKDFVEEPSAHQRKDQSGHRTR